MEANRVNSTMESLHLSHNLIFRIKGGVAIKIWPQVTFGILYAVAIVCLDVFVPGLVIDFPMTIVSVMGMVIGLLLVFRTNTAYQSYMEGRRVWSAMTQQIRVLIYQTWLGVKEETPKAIIEKATAINLYVAFAYATKNHLRGEYEYDERISNLISHVPKFQTRYNGAHNQNGINRAENSPGKDMTIINIPNDECINNLSTRNKIRSTFTFLRKLFTPHKDAKGETGFTNSRLRTCKACDKPSPTNLPLEIIYCIASYCNNVIKKEKLDGRWMIDAITRLMDSLTQFERIRKTPIPLAYSVHLHQSVWLYLLSLPFQLVGKLGWVTIPAMGVTCYAFLGILAIGWEIENPFGYDDNDLPLDDFCEVIKHEAQMVTGHKYPDCENWIFSPENFPLNPTSSQTATELTENELRALFLKRSLPTSNIPKKTAFYK